MTLTSIGRALVVGGLSLLFVAYFNFGRTALSSPRVADYVKNHFVREIMFGAVLASLVIALALRPLDQTTWLELAGVGSTVVLPFWIATMFGWSSGGMSEVWGESIGVRAAYAIHGAQTAAFYVSLALLWVDGSW